MCCHDDAMTHQGSMSGPGWPFPALALCRDGFEPRDGFELPSGVCRDGFEPRDDSVLPSGVCRDGFEPRDDSVLTRDHWCGDGFGQADCHDPD